VKSLLSRSWPPAVVILLSFFLWYFLIATNVVPSYLVPSPFSVAQTFSDSFNDYVTALKSTLTSTLIGFSLSALLGFACALVFASSEFLKKAFLPFAVFFQTVPIIAIAPLLVIWFGFGEPTVRVSAFIVSFFPVLANSLEGLLNIDPGLDELFTAFSASRFQRLWSLQIPSSMASFFTGLQIAAGLAVIGAIVGEFIAGGGLGGLIDSARTQQRVDLVFGAILLSSGLGVVLIGTIRLSFLLLISCRPFAHPRKS
jgi:NitT/TauT family transport system permease protein